MTGDYVGWLNSDDSLLPHALRTWAELIHAQPQAVLWVGATQLIDRDGGLLELHRPQLGDLRALAMWNFEAEFYQPGCLFSRHGCEQVGGLDERLHFALDPDLWMRLRGIGEFAACDIPVACARIYPEAKSQRDAAVLQMELIAMAFQRGQPEAARERLIRFGQTMTDAYRTQRNARRLRNRLRTFFMQRIVEPAGRLLGKPPRR